MNILQRQSTSDGVECLTLVWLIGVGLIGSAVRSVLLCRYDFSDVPITHTWGGTPTQNDREADVIQKRLEGLAHSFTAVNPVATIHVKILWVAGRSGFDAPEEELKPELVHFQRVLVRGQNLSESLPEAEIGFHLVSSGGGLFEGQRCVDRHSLPQTLRPYSRLKKTQEELLQAEANHFGKFIYRPSSVYGDIFGDHRLGLIPSMVLSAIRHGVITISGNLSTLRDYVYAGDVGAFLARELIEPIPSASCGPVFLASGRASSILEIRLIVERVTRRKTYITFGDRPNNVGDNTYTSNALPSSYWYPVDIETGVRRIYAQWCKRERRMTA